METHDISNHNEQPQPKEVMASPKGNIAHDRIEHKFLKGLLAVDFFKNICIESPPWTDTRSIA